MRKRAGSSVDAASALLVARNTYDDLAGVLVPLIGQEGVVALSSRALQISRPASVPAAVRDPSTRGESFDSIRAWLERPDEAGVIDTAAAVLSALALLLVTFIGEGLTLRLLQKAWPDGFSGVAEEIHQ
ncbi:MAG: hypothetical protein ABI837_09275 [Acidobacteriota bacterium]